MASKKLSKNTLLGALQRKGKAGLIIAGRQAKAYAKGVVENTKEQLKEQLAAGKEAAKEELARRKEQLNDLAKAQVKKLQDQVEAKKAEIKLEIEKKKADLKAALAAKEQEIKDAITAKVDELKAKAAEKAQSLLDFRASAKDIVAAIKDKTDAALQVDAGTFKAAAAILGFKGGSTGSPAKRAANQAKSEKYWEEVRAGLRPGPRR